MALILSPEQQYVYLCDHHTLGRLQEKVDTLVDDSFISLIHAVIQWQSPYWKLRDLSTNGTWLNGTRIPRNQHIKLSLNDKIQLGSPEAKPVIFKDNSEPSDVLVGTAHKSNKKPDLIPLTVYHFLPDDQDPEVVLYKKTTSGLLKR